MLLVIGGWETRRFFPYPAIFARLGIENWQVWEFHDYFELDPSELSVVVDDRRLRDIEDPPIHMGDEVFLHYALIREHIDPFVFWDEGAQRLFFSTDAEISWLTERMVSIAYLQDRYTDFTIEYRPEFNTVTITRIIDPIGHTIINRITESTRRTAVRYLPNRTAYITKWIPSAAPLTIFNTAGDFVRVRTQEGLLGYVLAADLESSQPFGKALSPLSPLRHPSPRINLSWELITNPAANTHAMNNPLPENLNVISPTWFNFDPYALNGSIISFASREYVDWAHAHGVEVWAKAFDSNHTVSAAILTNYQARERAVYQLICFVQEYNLDGININFEHIRSTDGGYYVQFLRELAVEMRRIGSTLSVATFVPAAWHSQYYHELVGRTVDFVAIMTYDEHTANSDTPGPVASLPFVERFIEQTLDLIPREKVLMGLPLYNRLWIVAPDGSHSIENLGMMRPWTLVDEWGVTPVWDPVAGSYYAEFNAYRIWIECERSIAEKPRIFDEHDLAGVASWRRGLESPGVWDKIDRVLGN